MIKLLDLVSLVSYACLDFEEDSFIQVLDEETQAHYRKVDDKLVVGGDVLPGRPTTLSELYQREVVAIEMNPSNQMEFYVK